MTDSIIHLEQEIAELKKDIANEQKTINALVARAQNESTNNHPDVNIRTRRRSRGTALFTQASERKRTLLIQEGNLTLLEKELDERKRQPFTEQDTLQEKQIITAQTTQETSLLPLALIGGALLFL